VVGEHVAAMTLVFLHFRSSFYRVFGKPIVFLLLYCVARLRDDRWRERCWQERCWQERCWQGGLPGRGTGPSLR
jgi:hypothetical protein